MASGALKDYLGVGVASARPTTPSLATGVAGYWYATDTGTLSVWDGSTWTNISSGGGSLLNDVAQFDTGSNSASSSAFAFKGIIIQPSSTIKASAIYAGICTQVSGAVYQGVVAPLSSFTSGSPTISSTPSTTNTFTSTGATTAFGWTRLAFASPVTLTSGTPYWVAFGRTDSTSTYVLPTTAPLTRVWWPAGPFVLGFTGRLASTSPANGNTIDTNSSAVGGAGVGLEWSL